jgi:hypothetical protein
VLDCRRSRRKSQKQVEIANPVELIEQKAAKPILGIVQNVAKANVRRTDSPAQRFAPADLKEVKATGTLHWVTIMDPAHKNDIIV